MAEYLRNRKLTLAVDDLLNTDQKVIDIALKYNYDSADALSFAFKKFHGNSASEVREGKNYKLFPKMKLALKVIGGSQMNIKIETKPSFKVAGVLKENIDSNQCPSTCFFISIHANFVSNAQAFLNIKKTLLILFY